MSDPAGLGLFLAAAAAVSLLWGLALRHLDERSQAFRRGLLFLLGFTRRPPGEVRALLLTALYCLLGASLALLFAGAFGLRPSFLVSVSAAHAGLAVLGIVGEISSANLLVGLGCWITRQGGERFAELREVPWMKGLRELPPALVPAMAAAGGVVEEVFFRGVLLLLLTERLQVSPWAAVPVAGSLFVLQQLVQVRTAFQAMVIGSGCVAISLVGGLLVVLTGSVVPAVLCHASFVVFFMPRDRPASAGASPGAREAAA